METGTIVLVLVCAAILAAIIGFVGAAIVRAIGNLAPAAGAATAQPQGILNPNAAQWTPMDVNNAVDRGCDITHWVTGGANYTRVRPQSSDDYQVSRDTDFRDDTEEEGGSRHISGVRMEDIRHIHLG